MFKPLFIIAVALCLCTLSLAEDKAQALDRKDHKFVTEAATGGMLEVELGKLAADKAASDSVKKFGQQMVTDHSKANDELKSIAEKKGVEIPASLPKKEQKEVDRLAKLSGAEFDKAYMKLMVSDHEDDVKEFEKASKNAADPDLKSFAEKTLPTLKDHLKMAQDTYNDVHGKKS